MIRFLVLLLAASMGCTQPQGVEGGIGAIIDGEPARPDQAHATAMIVTYGEVTCSGTLIAPRVVLTAGHCLVYDVGPAGEPITYPVEELGAAAGALSLDPSRVVPVERVAVHPRFDAERLFDDTSWDPTADPLSFVFNDIALMILRAPIDDVTPVPVLPGSEVDARLVDGRRLEISGFGLTEWDPAWLDDPTWEPPEPRLHIGTTRTLAHTPTDVLVGRGRFADACFGDSGGPAYIGRGSDRRLVGVASRLGTQSADPADLCGDGSVYTIASHYERWIARQARGLYPAEDPPPPPEPPPPPPEPPPPSPPPEPPPPSPPPEAPPTPTSSPTVEHVTYGCAAGGPASSPSAPLLLGAFALLVARRRR